MASVCVCVHVSGDQISLDGVIVKGQAQLDESAVSGESVPVSKKKSTFVCTQSNFVPFVCHVCHVCVYVCVIVCVCVCMCV